LLRPHLEADGVESILQRVDVGGAAEAPTEVAGGGGVGDTAGAEGVEEGFVVATEFDVLQTGAAT
jgi:hypothetical protein